MIKNDARIYTNQASRRFESVKRLIHLKQANVFRDFGKGDWCGFRVAVFQGSSVSGFSQLALRLP
jgi:hypothetical protein